MKVILVKESFNCPGWTSKMSVIDVTNTLDEMDELIGRKHLDCLDNDNVKLNIVTVSNKMLKKLLK